MFHLMELCFHLIVGNHRDGRTVVGFKALGDGGSVIFHPRAALVSLEQAVGHGVC